MSDMNERMKGMHFFNENDQESNPLKAVFKTEMNKFLSGEQRTSDLIASEKCNAAKELATIRKILIVNFGDEGREEMFRVAENQSTERMLVDVLDRLYKAQKSTRTNEKEEL